MAKKLEFKEEILKGIKPAPEVQKAFQDTTITFLQKLNRALKADKLNAEAILGGSGAKDTWLAGNYDVDIFVLFDYKKYFSSSEKLSDLLAPVLKKTFPAVKIERLHGSRDYFQLSVQKLNFEIVPILKIKKAEEAVNITDVSPLHAQWVKKKTSCKANLKLKNKLKDKLKDNLKDEIRLAKQFFKVNKLYGAESYLNGFSGYVTEILIINYGSLEKLLQAALKWKEKEVIDVSKYYPKKDALFHLNKSKQQSPIIIIDPVDKSRNAAAALSTEKFLLLKEIASAYLKNPRTEFFVEKKIEEESLRKEAQEGRGVQEGRETQKTYLTLIYLEIESFPGKVDVEGAKLLKAFEFLKEKLLLFGVKKADWEWNKKNRVKVYFFLEKKELPKVEIKVGPPLTMKEYTADFQKKNKNCYEEKGRMMAKIERKNYLLPNFLTELLREKYFTEKIKKVEKVIIV